MYSELRILFGTQTGTALEASISLYDECRKRGFPASVSPLVPFCLSPQFLTVLIVSTTGDGDPPTSILPFWAQVMAEAAESLEGMEFTVFGLGDSGYQQFNITARKLYARLVQLGAVGFYRKGLGDDQHDFEYEGEFDPWVAGLWSELSGRLPSIPPLSSCPLPWLILPSSNPVSQWQRGNFRGVVIEKKKITVADPEVYLIKIETDAEFHTGDVCDLYPENNPDLVAQIATGLNLNTAEIVEVHANSDSGLVNCYSESAKMGVRSVGELLGKWSDVHKSPSRRSLSSLIPFIRERSQAEKVGSMTDKSTEGRSEYHRYVTKEKRNLAEILWDFHSISTLGLSDLMAITGISAPRSYSICSLPCDALTLLVTIKKTQTPFRRLITGLTSQYIQRLRVGDEVRFDVRRKDAPGVGDDSHMVVVACGSGIAAFWGMIRARMDRGIDGNVVFFGCREENCCLLREEMLEYEKKGL